jgi:hypothetical protein
MWWGAGNEQPISARCRHRPADRRDGSGAGGLMSATARRLFYVLMLLLPGSFIVIPLLWSFERYWRRRSGASSAT